MAFGLGLHAEPVPAGPAQATTRGQQGGPGVVLPAPATYTINGRPQAGWFPPAPHQSVNLQPGQTQVAPFGNSRR